VSYQTRKRKQKLSPDAQLHGQNIFVPEFLEEIYDFPDGNFTLFHKNRNIGIGFKKTDGNGNVRLFWIKRWDLFASGTTGRRRSSPRFSASRYGPRIAGYIHF
jgi:hypothetical protein